MVGRGVVLVECICCKPKPGNHGRYSANCRPTVSTLVEALKGTQLLQNLNGSRFGRESEFERQTAPANDANAPSAAVAAAPGAPDLMELERHQRALTQPAIVAISILCACFSFVLMVCVTRAYTPTRFPFLRESPPTAQIVIGATGIFACLVLFTIGYVVNRLK